MRAPTDKLVHRLFILLNIIICLKILGYFTLSENVAITRVLKILLRVGTTIWLWYIYKKLKKRNFILSYQYENILTPGFYIAYLALGLVSFLWSTDVGYSALQWVMATESLVFILLFIKIKEAVGFYFPNRAFRYSSFFANGIFFILSGLLIGLMIDPDTFYRMTRGGEEARFGGYLMNPNELGMLASIGGSLAFMEIKAYRNKFYPILMLIIALIALVLTGSRSSTIGFLLITFVFINKSSSRNIKMLVYAAMALAVPFILQVIIFKAGDVEEVLSMTGRLPFWSALLNEGIVQEPLLGFGFMRIYYTDAFQSVHTYAGKMTHNTFLQVLMNLGFIGLFIAISQLVLNIRNYAQSNHAENKMLFMCIFIPAIINSFTEFGIFGETNYAILFYQFLVLLFVVKFNPNFSLSDKITLKKLHKQYPELAQ